MLGGNVCYHHGGNAPQVKAKAQRRLQQAADSLVQRLLGFALDGGVDDNVALRAIRDALDRAGMAAKTELAVEVKQEPWEELLGDVAQITKAQHEAMKRGEFAPAQAPQRALPASDDIVDAEVVEDAHERPASSTGERADRSTPPEWAEPAPARPTRALTTAEAAAADAAAANRAAGVSQMRRKRR
ncbi:hypothetical protein [Mycobacterium neglectum]|uniref:hypothetical protein n=1 Tax=Mycobacterium neglectum TaxID=242737 RepID=UPI000BFEDA39|nr:hypothetical protein [Mycobacterium neglectum]